MAVTVKKITLWRTQIADRPGALDKVLAPLAEAGADLRVVMGYRHAGDQPGAAVEVAPVSGKKAAAAAMRAGLAASSCAALLVEGDNKPGLGHAIAQAIAQAGINVAFLVAQVVATKYSAVIGLDSEADARKVASLIKKVSRRHGK
jgi:hypothetical protein